MVGLKGMAEVFVSHDRVPIAPTDLLLADKSRLFKFRDDSDRRSLGDAHRDSYVSNAHLRISSETDDDVAMVTKEGPADRCVLGALLERTRKVSLLFGGGALSLHVL